jgi:hypothetical protein
MNSLPEAGETPAVPVEAGLQATGREIFSIIYYAEVLASFRGGGII